MAHQQLTATAPEYEQAAKLANTLVSCSSAVHDMPQLHCYHEGVRTSFPPYKVIQPPTQIEVTQPPRQIHSHHHFTFGASLHIQVMAVIIEALCPLSGRLMALLHLMALEEHQS